MSIPLSHNTFFRSIIIDSSTQHFTDVHPICTPIGIGTIYHIHISDETTNYSGINLCNYGLIFKQRYHNCSENTMLSFVLFLFQTHLSRAEKFCFVTTKQNNKSKHVQNLVAGYAGNKKLLSKTIKSFK